MRDKLSFSILITLILLFASSAEAQRRKGQRSAQKRQGTVITQSAVTPNQTTLVAMERASFAYGMVFGLGPSQKTQSFYLSAGSKEKVYIEWVYGETMTPSNVNQKTTLSLIATKWNDTRFDTVVEVPLDAKGFVNFQRFMKGDRLLLLILEPNEKVEFKFERDDGYANASAKITIFGHKDILP
jgi:hypothetical protein